MEMQRRKKPAREKAEPVAGKRRKMNLNKTVQFNEGAIIRQNRMCAKLRTLPSRVKHKIISTFNQRWQNNKIGYIFYAPNGHSRQIHLN